MISRQAVLAGVAFGLLGLIAAEIALGAGSADVEPAPPAPPISNPPHPPMPDRSPTEIATMLDRPLFAADRRPAAAAPAAGPGDAGDAAVRLSGIIVDRTGATGLFVSGGRTVEVREGGEVSGLKVKRIAIGEVTVQGRQGQQVLHPSFDHAGADTANAAAAPADAAPPQTEPGPRLNIGGRRR